MRMGERAKTQRRDGGGDGGWGGGMLVSVKTEMMRNRERNSKALRGR